MGQWTGTVAIATAASAAFQSGGFGFLTDVLGASAGSAGGRGLGNALAGMLGAGPGDVSVSMPSSVAKGSGKAPNGGATGQTQGAPGGSTTPPAANPDGYSKPWIAAWHALAEVARRTDPLLYEEWDSEKNGFIYRDGSRYFFTDPVDASPGGVSRADVDRALALVPEGAEIVGDYHWHGVLGANYSHERFSQAGDVAFGDGYDRKASWDNLRKYSPARYRSYLGTPQGRFVMYEAVSRDVGRETTLWGPSLVFQPQRGSLSSAASSYAH